MIVIKGKMPKGTGCDGCEFQTSTCEQLDACTCYLFEGVIHNFHTERHPDCPIKGEIPDEHGDLIERSAVIDIILTNPLMQSDTVKVCSLVHRVKNAPTIVEASK